MTKASIKRRLQNGEGVPASKISHELSIELRKFYREGDSGKHLVLFGVFHDAPYYKLVSNRKKK